MGIVDTALQDVLRLARWIAHVARPAAGLSPSAEPPLNAPRPARAASPRPATESEVVKAILQHVQNLEPSLGPIRVLASEVRTHGRSRADILLLADDLVSVEAKLTNWTRALGQAALNLTVVDRSYVAMWAGHIPDPLLTQAEEHGIGVIEVHPDGLEILVKAVPGMPDATAKATVLKRLSEGGMHTGTAL